MKNKALYFSIKYNKIFLLAATNTGLCECLFFLENNGWCNVSVSASCID